MGDMHCQDYFPAFVNLMLNNSPDAVIMTEPKEIVKVSRWKLLGFSADAAFQEASGFGYRRPVTNAGPAERRSGP